MTLTAVLNYAFVLMDYTKVYDDYSILTELKNLLGKDLPNLLNRIGDYGFSHDMSPQLEDLVEDYCQKDTEKPKFLKWLSDNGYKGLKTPNELITKIESIIEDNPNNEELVKQHVSSYLREIFSNLSERNIEDLNFFIPALNLGVLYESHPYMEELLVTLLHDEISKPDGKLKEQIGEINLSIIEKGYHSIQNKKKKKEKEENTLTKITERADDRIEEAREKEEALNLNEEGYSKETLESLVSEAQQVEDDKLEGEKTENALEKDRQLKLIEEQRQKEELRAKEEKIQQEQKLLEAETRKKENAEKEVEKVSNQIKNFLSFIKSELNNPNYGDQLRKSLFLKLNDRKGVQTIEDYFDTLDYKSLVITPPQKNVICVISAVYDSFYLKNLFDDNSHENNYENDKRKENRRSKFDELDKQFKIIKTANNRGSDEDEKANRILEQVKEELKCLTDKILPKKEDTINGLLQEITSIEKNILDITELIEKDKDELAKLGCFDPYKTRVIF